MTSIADAAVRSLLLALAVWGILRMARLRSVQTEKAAWTAVLALALLAPLLLPLAARMPGVAIVLPAVVRPIVRPIVRPMIAERAASPDSGVVATAGEAFATNSTLAAGDRFPNPIVHGTDHIAVVTRSSVLVWRQFSVFELAALFYLCVAGILVCRLVYGLVSALSLWCSAEPVSPSTADLAGGLRLRFSDAVSSPVTLGSGVVLPADYSAWDSEKLRVVLAHERTHICYGDFYLQALAGLYAALVWFSPLGWWLKRKLTDLGEALSDRSGLEAAGSSSSYAQILLEFAAAPRPNPIGVAMARPSHLSRRIERLLNPNTFRETFTGNRRALLAALLVPGVLFAATALVRVQAATEEPQQTIASSQRPVAVQITEQARTDDNQPAATPDVSVSQSAVPAVPKVMNAPGVAPTPATAPVAPVAPVVPIAPVAPVSVQAPNTRVSVRAIHVEVPAKHIEIPAKHIDVPAKHIEIPAKHIEIQARHIDVPAKHVDAPGVHVDVPAQHIDIEEQHIDVPAKHIDVPAQHIDVPAVHVDVPAIHIDIPSSERQDGSGGHASFGATGELLAMLDGFDLGTFGHVKRLHGFLQNADAAPLESRFDRTLSISGKLDLHVLTGSGNIHFTHGSGNQVVIHGRVRSRVASDADEVKAIAANPPIVQTGNAVTVGQQHQQDKNHIQIDYDIEAPADAVLDAQSGSGNITDEGVGQNSIFMTGSGNITATGLQGGFKSQTGSGNIEVENTGEGDARAQTGSGNIVIRSVHGAFNGQTGSGNINVKGTPTSDWKLATGSGNVDLNFGSAALTLDAVTGSGKITTADATAMQVSSDHHHFHGQLHGGGPTVKIDTGNGNIHIE